MNLLDSLLSYNQNNLSSIFSLNIDNQSQIKNHSGIQQDNKQLSEQNMRSRSISLFNYRFGGENDNKKVGRSLSIDDCKLKVEYTREEKIQRVFLRIQQKFKNKVRKRYYQFWVYFMNYQVDHTKNSKMLDGMSKLEYFINNYETKKANNQGLSATFQKLKKLQTKSRSIQIMSQILKHKKLTIQKFCLNKLSVNYNCTMKGQIFVSILNLFIKNKLKLFYNSMKLFNSQLVPLVIKYKKQNHEIKKSIILHIDNQILKKPQFSVASIIDSTNFQYFGSTQAKHLSADILAKQTIQTPSPDISDSLLFIQKPIQNSPISSINISLLKDETKQYNSFRQNIKTEKTSWSNLASLKTKIYQQQQIIFQNQKKQAHQLTKAKYNSEFTIIDEKKLERLEQKIFGGSYKKKSIQLHSQVFDSKERRVKVCKKYQGISGQKNYECLDRENKDTSSKHPQLRQKSLKNILNINQVDKNICMNSEKASAKHNNKKSNKVHRRVHSNAENIVLGCDKNKRNKRRNSQNNCEIGQRTTKNNSGIKVTNKQQSQTQKKQHIVNSYLKSHGKLPLHQKNDSDNNKKNSKNQNCKSKNQWL